MMIIKTSMNHLISLMISTLHKTNVAKGLLNILRCPSTRNHNSGVVEATADRRENGIELSSMCNLDLQRRCQSITRMQYDDSTIGNISVRKLQGFKILALIVSSRVNFLVLIK